MCLLMKAIIVINRETEGVQSEEWDRETFETERKSNEKERVIKGESDRGPHSV